MADLDTIESTSDQRHAERMKVIEGREAGFSMDSYQEPVAQTLAAPLHIEPELKPFKVMAVHHRLKSVEGHLEIDASKAIEHLLSLIRYVMNSDGEIPRCTEATRTYLRQHLDF